MLLEKVNNNAEFAGRIDASELVSGDVPILATPAFAAVAVARTIYAIDYQVNKK